MNWVVYLINWPVYIHSLTHLPVCCRRLAKSTLLLIPLFGVNYMVFVYLVETESDGMEEYKILFDLVLGSFQVYRYLNP